MLKKKLLINLGLLLILIIGTWQILGTNTINANNRFVYVIILASIMLFFLVLINMHKNKLVKNLCLLIIAMSGFSFTLVPLYNVFCEVTGLNGKVDLTVAAATTKGVDLNRQVTVEFVVNHNRSMPWIFKPKDSSITLHPGELASTAYYAKNPTAVTMRAQAIPSISPSKVSKYFQADIAHSKGKVLMLYAVSNFVSVLAILTFIISKSLFVMGAMLLLWCFTCELLNSFINSIPLLFF